MSASRDDLTPPIAGQALPEEVKGRRRAQAELETRERDVYAPRIVAHVAAHRMALDTLERLHQDRADVLDFDLVGDTQPAAVWQMAGRCIAISRLMLDAITLGYSGEVLILSRSLHEATRLLDAFVYDEDTTLVRTWLADEGSEWVRPSAARKAIDAYEKRIEDAMVADGDKPVKRSADLSRRLYDQQSQAAHHRRRYVQNAVSPDLRQMVRGPETDWTRRASIIATVCQQIEEAVMSIGEALERFYGQGFYEAQVKPFVVSFEALRQAQPLT